MGVILICDIGWNKSELRNKKNKNFEISECWSVLPALGNLLSAKGNDPKIVIYFKQTASRIAPSKKLGSRMDAPIFVFEGICEIQFFGDHFNR